MTRHIQPETLQLSDVDQVVRLLKPKDIEQCRRDVEDAIKWVAGLPPRVPPVTVKKQLDRVTAGLKKVQQAIDLLPHGWRMAMRTQKLDRAIAQSEELSASITATRSGGSAKVQTIALKKDVAAAQALDLLAKYGDGCRPTTNPDGKFYRIARLLSGQKSDMARACASALSDK